MLEVKPALATDFPVIKQLLLDLDLDYDQQNLSNFFVAKLNGEIVGIANLEKHKDFTFLESFGISPIWQKQGLAAQFLNCILKSNKQDIYLYTIIPSFFAKFGFKIVPAPDFIPTRKRYLCSECESPEKCVCLLAPQQTGKKKHDSRIS